MDVLFGEPQGVPAQHEVPADGVWRAGVRLAIAQRQAFERLVPALERALGVRNRLNVVREEGRIVIDPALTHE